MPATLRLALLVCAVSVALPAVARSILPPAALPAGVRVPPLAVATTQVTATAIAGAGAAVAAAPA